MTQNPANIIDSLTNQPATPKLFATPNYYVKSGDLITFSYSNWKNDPSPLVIVADTIFGNRVRGVNLHYLTFPYIKNILRSNTVGFSYRNIKGDKYIVDAFRTYKWSGIGMVKKLDTKFLLTVMATARSFDPNQIAAIRKTVEEQLRRSVNQTVQDIQEQGPPQIGKV